MVINAGLQRRVRAVSHTHNAGPSKLRRVCAAEIGGVTVIWKTSKLLPVMDYEGNPMISEIVPGRLLHIRFQVQADNSEFDMLAAYMPAPSANEARRAEIRSC